MQEMHVYGVSFDMVGKQPIVLLKTAAGDRYLPIWIGPAEAQAILTRLQETETPRPMTHDLLASTVAGLGAEVVRIEVTDLRDNTFYARITLRRDGADVELDSRPSDAIALAVRTQAPIFAADAVIESSAVTMDDDQAGPPTAGASSDDPDKLVEDFKRFLESVDPEQFKEGDG